ncbi:hypothetical protein EV363DRAFT_1516279 [Boletus edulis]|nr:hypothetical protein EV363DRAFT_1516279 [Boletus edulis]
MAQIRHAGPHAPRKSIPWTSANSVCCQQGPPASLDRASFPPSPDAHALRSPCRLTRRARARVLRCCRTLSPSSSRHARTLGPRCTRPLLPTCLPSPCHLARRARTQPALVLPTIALHNHGRPCAHFGALPRPHPHACPLPALSQQRRGDDDDAIVTPSSSPLVHLALALALSLPSPAPPRARNSDVVTTTTRRSYCRDRHAVVVTTRPAPALALTLPLPARPRPHNSDAVTTTTRPPRVHHHARFTHLAFMRTTETW